MKNFNENSFKKSAKNLSVEIEKRTGNKVSHMQSIQILSQALFSKPYEEIKETLFKEKEEKQEVIVLVEAGSATILYDENGWVSGDYPGTDMCIGEKAFKKEAEIFASKLGAKLVEMQIPVADMEHYEDTDVFNRIQYMNLFNPEDSLIFQLTKCDFDMIIVNNMYCKFGISSDWINEVENGGYHNPIWLPEMKDGMGGFYEFFFSFEEICNAKKTDEKEWLIQSDTQTAVVRLY